MMGKESPTEKEFLKHVENRQMEVIRDEGLHRHIRFKRPGTSNQYFDLITWPGSLCFTGDMGTYVFSRLRDMFEFFRDDRPGDKLHINLGYWAEKLDAADRRSGGAADQYSADKFRQRVADYLKDAEASRAVRQAVKDEVLNCADDGEFWAYHAISRFEHDGFRFHDFWEINCREYTYSFIWCCYALVWGIQQYDKAQDCNTPKVADSVRGKDALASA